MGYDGGYMMGSMHGLLWLFWVVLLGVLASGGAREASGFARAKHRVIARTSCFIDD